MKNFDWKSEIVEVWRNQISRNSFFGESTIFNLGTSKSWGRHGEMGTLSAIELFCASQRTSILSWNADDYIHPQISLYKLLQESAGSFCFPVNSPTRATLERFRFAENQAVLDLCLQENDRWRSMLLSLSIVELWTFKRTSSPSASCAQVLKKISWSWSQKQYLPRTWHFSTGNTYYWKCHGHKSDTYFPERIGASVRMESQTWLNICHF